MYSQRGFYPTGAHGIQTGPAFGADPDGSDAEVIDIELEPIDVAEDTELDLEVEVAKLKKEATGLQHWLMDGDADGAVTKAEVKTFAMGAATGFILSRIFFK
jgi:hypothetical protein